MQEEISGVTSVDVRWPIDRYRGMQVEEYTGSASYTVIMERSRRRVC